MKPQFFSRMTLTLLVMAWGACALAQDTLPIKELPEVTVTATKKTIPEHVWKSFESYFANAQNPTWYSINKNYLIKFMTDDNLNHALFTEKGKLVYHISYGYEKNLPTDVRKLVKSSYYDYDITRAIKVTEGNRLIWVVNLEDAKTLVLVRVEQDEMEEVQRVNKS